jgi:hypothetical protein
MFSFKTIKELVDSKKNFSLDPFDFLRKPLSHSQKVFPKLLPPLEIKLAKKPSLSTEPKNSKIFATSGVAEVKFRKVCNECNSTRKVLKKIKRSCSKKQFALKGMYKKCKKMIREAGKVERTDGMSPEFTLYKEKMKMKKRKNAR